MTNLDWLTRTYPSKELCQVGYMASNGLSFTSRSPVDLPFWLLEYVNTFIASEFFSFMKSRKNTSIFDSGGTIHHRNVPQRFNAPVPPHTQG